MNEPARAYINCPHCVQRPGLPRDSRNRLERGLPDCEICLGAGRVLKYRTGVEYAPGSKLVSAGGRNGCRNVMMEACYESCKIKTAKRAAMTPHGVACVGCDRLCLCPKDVELGDELRIVSK